MVRIFSIVALIVLFPIFVFPQEKEAPGIQKAGFGLCVGFNTSKFRNDLFDCTYGSNPLIGIFHTSGISGKVNIKNTLLYSVKSSYAIDKFSRLENVYLEYSLTPQIRLFEDFYLQPGICYSKLISSKKGISYAWKTKTDNTGFRSELNFILGIQHKLQDNLNVEINYTIPTSQTHTKNLLVSLNYVLTNRVHKKENYRHTREVKSADHILRLKSGTLLVRLKTSGSKINALIKLGKPEKAERVKIKQELENIKIISAFKKNFNFCRVAFFYSANSGKIKHREFGNIFLDDSLKIDKTIVIDTVNPIFIAEFGAIDQDTTKYFSHYNYTYNPGYRREKNYYTASSEFDFMALLIRDEKFVQLSDPFPYYVRAMHVSVRKEPEEALFLAPVYLPFFTWSYEETVERMNTKLNRFYKRNL